MPSSSGGAETITSVSSPCRHLLSSHLKLLLLQLQLKKYVNHCFIIDVQIYILKLICQEQVFSGSLPSVAGQPVQSKLCASSGKISLQVPSQRVSVQYACWSRWEHWAHSCLPRRHDSCQVTPSLTGKSVQALMGINAISAIFKC